MGKSGFTGCFKKFDRYNIPIRMAEIEWEKSTWVHCKGFIMEIENNNKMQNKEIQEKIYQILKQKANE